MWNKHVNKIHPYMVKIETPVGSGTGFLCMHNTDKNIFGIATAYHVIQYAREWLTTIKITFNDESFWIPASYGNILVTPETDSALVLFSPKDIGNGNKFPDIFIEFRSNNEFLEVGTEIGWLGYPCLAPSSECFFSGKISSIVPIGVGKAYLIDGVAINGVSGGPVFCLTKTLQIVGIISSYIPNKQPGDTLPGLSFAYDVSHFNSSISQMKSIEDAAKKNINK